MPRMQDVDPEKWARIQARAAQKKRKDPKPLRDVKETNPDRWDRIKEEAERTGRNPYAMLYAELGGRPEHEYAHGDQRIWDTSVFDAADHFAVYRPVPRYKRSYVDYAVALDDARSGERSILYAITKSGRSTCIERSDWDRLLERWKARNV